MADTPATKDTKTESKSDSDLAAQVRDLQNTIATLRAGTPLGLTPMHGAGIGDEVRESWSQYDQELAVAGEHPDQ